MEQIEDHEHRNVQSSLYFVRLIFGLQCKTLSVCWILVIVHVRIRLGCAADLRLCLVCQLQRIDGDNGRGPIPPNSKLEFELELLGWRTVSTSVNKLEFDITSDGKLKCEQPKKEGRRALETFWWCESL